MAALHLTVAGLLLLLTTAAALSDPQPPPEEPPTGCLDLVVAGMAAYDMYADLLPPGVLESANAQLPIDLDLTDRSAVERFLCNLAEVNGFSELSAYVGLSESMLREGYRAMMDGLEDYGVGEGEEGVRSIIRLYNIWLDVCGFAEQVGFSPDPPNGPHGQEDSSSEEQQQVDVSSAVASNFIYTLAEVYGEDFASDFFEFVALVSDHMGPEEPIHVDLEDLLSAIVESKSTAEFAAAINVPEEALAQVFYGIAMMSTEISPNAGYTMAEYMDVLMNMASTLLNLGFFSWE